MIYSKNEFFRDAIDKLLELTGETDRFEDIVGNPSWYEFLTFTKNDLVGFKEWYIDTHVEKFGTSEELANWDYNGFVTRFNLTNDNLLF